MFLPFYAKSCIGIFGYTYCDINLKLLPGKNTQNVNEQKNCCKNLGFVILVVQWAERDIKVRVF